MTKVDNEKMIGLNVRMLRERAEMSQADLVAAAQSEDMSHFHQTTLSRVESGARALRLSEAISIASVLGIATSELYESHSDNDRAASQNLAAAIIYKQELREAANRIGILQVQLEIAARVGVSDSMHERIESEQIDLKEIVEIVTTGYQSGIDEARADLKRVENG